MAVQRMWHLASVMVPSSAPAAFAFTRAPGACAPKSSAMGTAAMLLLPQGRHLGLP